MSGKFSGEKELKERSRCCSPAMGPPRRMLVLAALLLAPTSVTSSAPSGGASEKPHILFIGAPLPPAPHTRTLTRRHPPLTARALLLVQWPTIMAFTTAASRAPRSRRRPSTICVRRVSRLNSTSTLHALGSGAGSGALGSPDCVAVGFKLCATQRAEGLLPDEK